jgi:hypothetical protein
LAEINKIVALGCSYTYGHGLDDCIDPDDILKPGSNPSNFAWPNQLAKHLGVRKVLNLSHPGSSMKYALHILAHNKHELSNKTLVVCMPPDPHRSFRMGHSSIDHLLIGHPHGTITKSEHNVWVRSLDKADSMHTQILHCELLREYCKSLTGRLPVIALMSYNNTSIRKQDLNNYSQRSMYVHKHFSQSLNLSLVDRCHPHIYPLAADGKHPGELWHSITSRYLAEKIKKLCLL